MVRSKRDPPTVTRPRGIRRPGRVPHCPVRYRGVGGYGGGELLLGDAQQEQAGGQGGRKDDCRSLARVGGKANTGKYRAGTGNNRPTTAGDSIDSTFQPG